MPRIALYGPISALVSPSAADDLAVLVKNGSDGKATLLEARPGLGEGFGHERVHQSPRISRAVVPEAVPSA